VLFALVGLTILIIDHFNRVGVVALILAAGCLVAVLARLVVTYAQNVRMLQRSRGEAHTDALTGLANRRQLMLDLERDLGLATRDRPVMLALFDLDGFKRYNDSFGHPAGDALLARLGTALSRALGSRGTAYRMGGDEFCALLSVPEEGPDPIVAALAAALSDHGDGFRIECSYGVVVLPIEAQTSEAALRTSDQRMYLHKDDGRLATNSDSKNVLLQALQEQDPHLGRHLDDVGLLAEATARVLGLPSEETARIRLAAELHDIGKMAIPDSLINKPGPLNEREWEFMRRHTAIGERILLAAPSLAGLGPLVRSSHERWDGSGYPDGLARKEIPLGSRIISVADAYHAMTTDRPYQRAMSVPDAIAELRRCANTQFDADTVEAFCLGQLDQPNPAPVLSGPSGGA
jgi:diguanylate cyclase (GGDEF)-like protein